MVPRYPLILLSILACDLAMSEPTKPGFYFDQGVQASLNPLGLQAASKLFYRFEVFEPKGLLWETTKLDLGFQNNLSPSYEMAGVFASFEPVAFFNLTASAQVGSYYNALGFGFYELQDYNSSIDSTVVASANKKNAFGSILTLSPTLKAAYDIFAVSNTLSMTYFYADNGEGYFFERINNTPLKKSDVELGNSAYLLVNPLNGLFAGVNDWILYVPGSGYISHRVSVVAAYTHPINDNISLYGGLLLGTFLSDRYYQYSFYIGGQLGVTLKLN